MQLESELPLNSDPSSLKKLEKTLYKESKAEGSMIKHAVKDLEHSEKAMKKMQKDLSKATKVLAKSEKLENETACHLNKARHEHEIAMANVTTATKDLELKKEQEERLKVELAAKREQVEQALETQHTHNHERESKLAKIHAIRAGEDIVTSHPILERATPIDCAESSV